MALLWQLLPSAAGVVELSCISCPSATMHYAEMPQDVSCDSLSAFRAVDKAYHDENYFDLRLEVQLPEEAYLKTKGFRGFGKSPEKSNLNKTKDSTTRHSFRNKEGLNQPPAAVPDQKKKISAPSVFYGVTCLKSNLDNGGWVSFCSKYQKKKKSLEKPFFLILNRKLFW